MYRVRSSFATKLPSDAHHYHHEHQIQLSFEDFLFNWWHPSGNSLSIKHVELIACHALEDNYTSQFCKGRGTQAQI